MVLFGWNTEDVDRGREVNAYPRLYCASGSVFHLLGTLGRSPVLSAQATKGAASLDGKRGHRYSTDC
jgi:hypothetical protein